MDELTHTVRREDRERFWCGLLARGAQAKQGCMTLFALDHAWRCVPQQVSEPMLGVMRLTWWRDAIASVYSQSADHLKQPVLEALAAIPDKPAVTQTLLHDAVSGYETLLHEQPFATVDLLEQFVQTTTSSLHLAVLHLLMSDPPVALQKAVSHVGTAWGIWQIVRQIHRDIPQGHLLLPQDLAQQHNLLMNSFGSDAFTGSCAGVVRDMMHVAQGHIMHARDTLDEVPRPVRKQVMPVLSPAYLFTQYAARLQRIDHDVLTQLPMPLGGLHLLEMKWEALWGTM